MRLNIYENTLYARVALAWTKSNIKHSLRNEKLKSKQSFRDGRTEERMADDKTRKDREPKKLQEEKKKSSETEDHEKQRLATLKD